MKNDALGWAMNFSPATPKPSCVWKPIPNVSRFTTAVFAASSPTDSPIKYFSVSSGRDIIIFRILHMPVTICANSAHETADVFCERRLTLIFCRTFRAEISTTTSGKSGTAESLPGRIQAVALCRARFIPFPANLPSVSFARP